MVVALARDLGYCCYHTFDSRRSQPGFPDLVLARPRDGRLLAIECKQPGKAATAAQRWWIEALNAAGTLAFVATIDDWEWLVEVLR